MYCMLTLIQIYLAENKIKHQNIPQKSHLLCLLSSIMSMFIFKLEFILKVFFCWGHIYGAAGC